MVTSEQAQNYSGMWIHIHRIHIPFTVIKINGVETIIEPIDAPLILMSYPTHRAGQPCEGRNTSIVAIVIAHGLDNHGVAAHVTIEPTNRGIISRSIIPTIRTGLQI